jgi:putative copper resistance protein D
MKPACNVATLIERYFTERLMRQRNTVGAALLLKHSHALANVKEQLLIEMTHVPLALLGMLAAGSRWLELRMPRDNRVPSLVWPTCFVLAGFLLLVYREA